MKRFNLTLIVTLFLFVLGSNSAVLAQHSINLPVIRNQSVDFEALVAFYHSTGGESWNNNSGWLDATIPHCQWVGVTCDAVTGRVIALSLSDNNLQGPIPPEFGNLSSLQELSLPHNQLGRLPESFGNLSSLEELNLVGNQLSTLPESFGNLPSLKRLILDYNVHLFILPESFGNLPSLQELYLLGNQLRTLPESFGNLSSLQVLSLSSNELSILPESFGNLSVLESLGLSNNQLSTLPESFVNLTSLEWLDLPGNPISCLATQALVDWYNNIDTANPDSFPLCSL